MENPLYRSKSYSSNQNLAKFRQKQKHCLQDIFKSAVQYSKCGSQLELIGKKIN
jgi:hypothetical protein